MVAKYMHSQANTVYFCISHIVTNVVIAPLAAIFMITFMSFSFEFHNIQVSHCTYILISVVCTCILHIW